MENIYILTRSSLRIIERIRRQFSLLHILFALDVVLSSKRAKKRYYLIILILNIITLVIKI